ncbi:short chain dehydrogenase [Bradyrhizobium sp. cf659]|nr:short chain dehydrogenase [Bradyrhizobium sp. cf659]
MERVKKIAVVTGGSRGLGRNTVLSLARQGVDTIFTYNSALVDADAVAGDVEGLGRRAIPVQLDVGQISTFDAFVAKLRVSLSDFGETRFDYLVNNAGISHHNSLEQTTEAELDAVYRVNFKGPFFSDPKVASIDE